MARMYENMTRDLQSIAKQCTALIATDAFVPLDSTDTGPKLRALNMWAPVAIASARGARTAQPLDRISCTLDRFGDDH